MAFSLSISEGEDNTKPARETAEAKTRDLTYRETRMALPQKRSSYYPNSADRYRQLLDTDTTDMPGPRLAHKVNIISGIFSQER